MKLKVRRLQLRATTDAGPYGTDLTFGDGLTIVRAKNTSGKTLCMASIFYAMGLDQVFSQKKAAPIQYAMTDRLADGDEVHAIQDSHVLLELQNGEGKVVTVERPVKSGRDNRLVTVWPASIDERNSTEGRDFYIGFEGAAARSDGFHHFLADFIGWELPSVVKFDGQEAPLYIEYLFPYLYVEQKRGWGGLVMHTPTYIGIRDGVLRAFEYLLGLDTQELMAERQRLEALRTELRQKWTTQKASLTATVRAANGLVKGLSDDPPATPFSADEVEFLVATGEDWVPVGSALDRRKVRLAQLRHEEDLTVEEASPALSQELEDAREKLSGLELLQRDLREDVAAEEEQLAGIVQRLKALKQDLKRQQDIQRLRQLGSARALPEPEKECPTCHQGLPPTLLPLETEPQVMALTETVNFLKAHQRSFEGFEEDSRRILIAKQRKLDAVVEEAARTRARIRSLKESLTSSDAMPTAARIRERVLLEEEIRAIERANERLRSQLDRLTETAREWKDVSVKLRRMPKNGLTAADLQKLNSLQKSLVEQLQQYRFKTVNPREVEVAPASYKPEHEGFALTAQASGSDLVRLIWAYHVGLLEVAREFRTNHPGLLVFDSPRQQEVEKDSLAAFLRRVARAGASSQQVILTTSEPTEVIEVMLRDAPHTLHDIPARVLTRLPDS